MLASLAETIAAWKFKGFQMKKIRPPTTLNNSLSPKLEEHKSNIRIEFKGSCLKQDKAMFPPNNPVNLFVNYESDGWPQD